MKTLGISGKRRDAAAAIAVDGRIVAAATEECLARVSNIGYEATGGAPMQAIAACLETAGVTPAEIDRIVVVDEEENSGTDGGHHVAEALRQAGKSFGEVPSQARRILAVDADGLQAAASADEGAILVCTTEPASFVTFERDKGGLRRSSPVSGADRLVTVAATMARALGIDYGDPFTALDRVGPAEPEFTQKLSDVVHWTSTDGVAIDLARLTALIEHVGQEAGGDLAAPAIQNVRVDYARRALAASMRTRIAEVLHETADQIRTKHGASTLVLGGSMFAHPQLNTALKPLFDDRFRVASVPESRGRALGAALGAQTLDDSLQGPIGAFDAAAIGPTYSDHDIKRTLDNCRLDYVYEPDWQRLLSRTSTLLSQGKIVAWFQGPMAFGARPLGSRSILCDPSLRYSRENMNEYLRQVPLDEPLPVVFAPSAGQASRSNAFGTYDTAVGTDIRDRLRSALDSRQHVRVHDGAAAGRELGELLNFHYERTRVPALIETWLNGPGEPPACSPRHAVRTFFSSAIDALIIGRFILMKDYWLLRSETDV